MRACRMMEEMRPILDRKWNDHFLLVCCLVGGIFESCSIACLQRKIKFAGLMIKVLTSMIFFTQA